MANKKKNKDTPYQGRGSKGYSRKIHFKLSKKVQADFKKQGLNYSWNDSQKFVSLYLFDEYKDEYVSKIDLKEVENVAQKVDKGQFDNALKIKFRKSKPGALPPGAAPPDRPEPVEDCFSVWKVPLADIVAVEWYDISNTLRGLPENLNVRVNGGAQFGYTDIDHVKGLDYYESGVAGIIQNIRVHVENSSGPTWSGIRKLKPGRDNDGRNCSYFIDFVLEGADQDFEPEIIQEVEPLNEEEAEQRKARKKVSAKVKKENASKKEESRKTRSKVEAAKKRRRPTAAPPPEETRAENSQYILKMLELLKQDFKDGIYTTDEYRVEREKLISKLEKGGEI